jgi:hypothetical protein
MNDAHNQAIGLITQALVNSKVFARKYFPVIFL